MKTWILFKKITNVFLFISKPQNPIPDNILNILESSSYCCSSTCYKLSGNYATQELLITKYRPLQHLSATEGALQQYVFRNCFRTGHIWGRADEHEVCTSSPNKWVLQLDNLWKIKFPQIAYSCKEIIKFMCKIRKNKFGCRMFGLPCQVLCKSENECQK